MPDDKKKPKKEEYFIRTNRFIYTKEDLAHIIGTNKLGVTQFGPEESPVLLKKMIPNTKKTD